MAGAVTNAALRRMVRPIPVPPVAEPAVPARILRQAVTRAADTAAGLPLVVLGVELVEAPLDDLTAALDPAQLLVMLGADAGPEGVAALCPDLRAALIEMQTAGRLSPLPPSPRDATTADFAMAEPFVLHLLSALRADTGGHAIAPSLAGVGVLGRFANPRAAALALPDGTYRVIRLSIDLGLPDRQAALLIGLPLRSPPAAALAAPPADPGWTVALTRAVMEAPCALQAVLHRKTLTLGQVEGFMIGQVLPLPGVTVASVRVEGPGGSHVGPGKLGQMGGMRAVRLGPPPRPPQMEEMLPPPA
jgi:flagellar motor switch protein FliM